MRRAFYVLILPLLASCSLVPADWYEDSQGMYEVNMPAYSYTILPPPPETIFTGSERISQNNYVLNVNRMARVGETVLRVKDFKQDNYIVREMMLEKPVEVRVDATEMELPAKKYPIFGTFERDGETFFVLPKFNHIYFLTNMHGELQPFYLYEIKGSDKVTIFPYKATYTPYGARLKRVSTHIKPRLPYLDFEVIYDGIKNNQLTFFYKNSVPSSNGNSGSFDTLAYPADSTMISIEGRLIRILRADKDQISFVVVKD